MKRWPYLNILCWCCIYFCGVVPALAAISPDPKIKADLEEVFSSPPPVQGYPYQDFFEKAAGRYGLALPYVLAVVRGESFFDPKAKSSKGAIGLMQVLPSTAADYGLKAEDLLDLEKNIDVGVHYLADLYAKLEDPYLALAAYYCGPGGVDKENFTLRQDCNEYVHYIYSHLKKIIARRQGEATVSSVEIRHFVFTRFDNFIDADSFITFLSTKLPNLELDLFRREIVHNDHVRYQYQILAAYKKDKEKAKICREVERATGFSFCE